jgi:hypothetical protein
MVTSQDWSPPLLIAQIEEGGYTFSVFICFWRACPPWIRPYYVHICKQIRGCLCTLSLFRDTIVMLINMITTIESKKILNVAWWCKLIEKEAISGGILFSTKST